MITENEPFDSTFQQTVQDLLANHQPVVLSTYILDKNEEAKLNYILDELLKKYNLVEAKEVLYTACRELTVNSAKAAVKRIYFEENELDINDLNDYQQAMPQFKKIINSNQMNFYHEKFKSMGLAIEIHFYHSPEQISMQVVNNFPLLKEEEDRIKEKFANAMKFDNIVDFYMAHADNTEGTGMGITLIVILLAQTGFPRELFTIYSNSSQKRTIAQIELPFAQKTTPP